MKKILILIPLLVLISCGVQKRKYQKGYYVNWSKSKPQEKKEAIAGASDKSIKKSTIKAAVSPVVSEEYETVPVLETSTDKGLQNIKTKVPKNLFHRDEPCDVLIFNDGSEIQGRVIEITATEVKYKKCDMPDGPFYLAKKTSLFMVKYANGTKEMFKEAKAPAVSSQGAKKEYTGPKKANSMAVASLVMGILCVIPYLIIPAGIMAIVFGNIAQRQINANPEYYTGESMAKAGKILGIVFLSLLAFFLILGILLVLILI